MEEWTSELLEAFDQAVETLETWIDDANAELEKQTDAWSAVSESIYEQLYDSISEALPLDEMTREIEKTLEEWLDPLFEIDREFEFHWDFEIVEDDNDPFVTVTYVPPTHTCYPTCRGCQHYHGQMYGENLLVCGMHPYGWEGETCPDWKGDSPSDR
ncbi:MAG: hypothetical protein J7641_12420 [Cyanobacteria bacterium SID2]|nr:hypothetical protein [Cyanobacteria bacterium SID2]MBP0003202.1 hypothetical protein [Cyanobacteria bacterium SBC]